MNSKEFELRMMSATGRGRADVELRASLLRGMGLWPSGARGINAPHLNASELVSGLLATAGTEKPSEAARYAVEFSSLRELEAQESGTFLNALTLLMQDFEQSGEIEEIVLHKSSMVGEIKFKGGAANRLFVKPESLESFDKRNLMGGLAIRSRYSISGPLFTQLAINLDLPNKSGWVGED